MHDRSKVIAMFREFPYLGKYFISEAIHEVYVRRWDNEMLNLPSVLYSGDLVSVRNELHLFKANQERVCVVGEDPAIVWWNPRTWYVYPPSIQMLDLLLKRPLTELEQVSVIVGFHSGPDRSGDSKASLTVWKAASEFKNLATWLEHTLTGVTL